MQMLAAGGMTVLTDGKRERDASNPRGYFEFDPVKRTAADASWVAEARGKAVKVIYQLLRSMPGGYTYRVILLRRDIDEVVASQKAMLRRLGKPPLAISEQTLAQGLEDGLRDTETWLSRQLNWMVLPLAHADLVAEPEVAAESLSVFCGGLNRKAMTAVVDPALYRERGQRA